MIDSEYPTDSSIMKSYQRLSALVQDVVLKVGLDT